MWVFAAAAYLDRTVLSERLIAKTRYYSVGM